MLFYSGAWMWRKTKKLSHKEAGNGLKLKRKRSRKNGKKFVGFPVLLKSITFSVQTSRT